MYSSESPLISPSLGATVSGNYLVQSVHDLLIEMLYILTRPNP